MKSRPTPSRDKSFRRERPRYVLTFNTPSKSCGASVFNGSRVVILDEEHERRYRRKVRRLGGRYANIILVTHAKASEHQGVAWWAIEDELHIEEVEAR